MRRTSLPPLLDCGVATRMLEGETESGDLEIVSVSSQGALVAVVDGLGHGGEAAEAARVAVATLRQHAHESVLSMVIRCHEALRKTRGVVLSVAAFNARDNSMTWLGVGNVEGVLLRAAPLEHPREDLVSRAGVVGYQLPPLRATVLLVSPGDTLIFATDGIRSEFMEELNIKTTPQKIADQILTRHAKSTDDALVLVTRYQGGQL